MYRGGQKYIFISVFIDDEKEIWNRKLEFEI